MKSFFRIILRVYLKYLTKLVLLFHRPTIIVIAGSTNKHFMKQAIGKKFLEKNISVRVNANNFNTEIGLPLAVLDLPSGYNSYRNWWPIIFLSLKKIFEPSFPKFLVLSLGLSDPGDIKYLLSIIRPQVAIVSDINQRYLEGFSGVEELLAEYVFLVKKLKPTNLLLLNNDNPRVSSLQAESRAKVISFGFNEKSDYQAVDLQREVSGQTFAIQSTKSRQDCNINRFGNHHIYAELVATIIEQRILKNSVGK